MGLECSLKSLILHCTDVAMKPLALAHPQCTACTEVKGEQIAWDRIDTWILVKDPLQRLKRLDFFMLPSFTRLPNSNHTQPVFSLFPFLHIEYEAYVPRSVRPHRDTLVQCSFQHVLNCTISDALHELQEALCVGDCHCGEEDWQEGHHGPARGI